MGLGLVCIYARACVRACACAWTQTGRRRLPPGGRTPCEQRDWHRRPAPTHVVLTRLSPPRRLAAGQQHDATVGRTGGAAELECDNVLVHARLDGETGVGVQVAVCTRGRATPQHRGVRHAVGSIGDVHRRCKAGHSRRVGQRRRRGSCTGCTAATSCEGVPQLCLAREGVLTQGHDPTGERRKRVRRSLAPAHAGSLVCNVAHHIVAGLHARIAVVRSARRIIASEEERHRRVSV